MHKLAGFFLGQGSVQALNLLTGFLLLRWLSVEQYAIYALLSGFQGTVGVIVEMGLGGSLTGLIAGRTDKATVGGYIQSAKRYRNLIFLFAVPFIAFAFAAVFLRHGWGWGLAIVLFLALLVNTFFLSWSNYYSIPFLIRHDMSGLYRLQILYAALRLAACWFLQFGGVICAAVVAWLTAIATTAMGWAYRKQSAPFIQEAEHTDTDKNREVLNFITPLVPATFFFAFQGQIGVLLISWFGKADSIAEIGALGRIAQIFVMLGAFNSVLIAPYIARTPENKLVKRYIFISLSFIFLSALFTLAGFYVPQTLIWLLGKNYSTLTPEIGWVVLSSSLSNLTNVLFTMHSARKWIFYWGSWSYVISILSTQAIMLCIMDLSTTHAVIFFGLISAAASFVVQVVWGFYGLSQRKSNQRVEP